MLVLISEDIRDRILRPRHDNSDGQRIADDLPDWIKQVSCTTRIISIPEEEFKELPLETQLCFEVLYYSFQQSKFAGF
jgi:hypothetical protein